MGRRADGMKDERGRYGVNSGGSTDLFGIEAAEINAIQPSNPYSATQQKELGGELGNCRPR